MESSRCISVVKNELNKLGLHYKTVKLGEVELKTDAPAAKLQMLDNALRSVGLELMDDTKNRLVKKINAAIYQLIYLSDESPKPNVSKYISKKVNYDYTYLSSLFSQVQGITIAKQIITQKIERVKDLLLNGELNLGDIAFKLQYSSVAHLSNQFKKVTGLTPSVFRQIQKPKSVSSNEEMNYDDLARLSMV
jgi:AraC-like DNA-binding protein